MTTGPQCEYVQSGAPILAIGARTALGLDAASSAAAALGSIAGFAAHPFMIDRQGQPMVVARDTTLDPGLPVPERLARTGASALQEAMAPLSDLPRPSVVRLFLGLPTTRPGWTNDDCGIVQQHLASELAAVAQLDQAGTYDGGHLALHAALLALRNGFSGHCLVGGLESWLNADALEWLDETGRLKTAAQPFGFIPGEAACFLLLGPGRAVATILSAATAAELKTGSDDICLGEGLTHAARAVLRSHGSRADRIYVDLNGLPAPAEEFGYTLVRIGPHVPAPPIFITPAEWFGDVGAAATLIAIMLAVHQAVRGYAGGTSLVLSGNGDRLRGAVLLQADARERI